MVINKIFFFFFFFYNTENIDDGKVIHLVVRPIDAPRNPDNGKNNY
jgi:hypothetical protein